MTIQAKRSRMTKTIDTDTNNVLFAIGSFSLTINADELTPEICKQAMLAGLGHKIGDAAAIDKDPETGLSATDETKYQAMVAMRDQLLSGMWNKTTREVGAKELSQTLQALINYKVEEARAKGVSVDEASLASKCRAWFDDKVKTLGKDTVFSLRDKTPAWSAAYKSLKPTKEVDSELLDELDDLI